MVRYSFIVLAVVFFVFGCGYTLQGSGSILPTDVRTVKIRMAENETTYPGLGPQFTEKLRSRFERYGTLKVVDPDEDADSELITKILSINTRVKSTTGDTDLALQMELYMTISAELKRKNGQILYRNTGLVAKETFASTSNVVVTSSSNFAQGGIGGDTLSSLGSREVSRGQEAEAVDSVMEESARRLYLDAVAADF